MIQILWTYIEAISVILFRLPDGRVESSGLTQNLIRKIDTTVENPLSQELSRNKEFLRSFR